MKNYLHEINKTFYGGAKEFAEKSKKDYSNIHKEIKGKRKIIFKPSYRIF